MHAHICASASSADELTKHLTKLNAFRMEENEEIEHEPEDGVLARRWQNTEPVGTVSAGDNVRGSHVGVKELKSAGYVLEWHAVWRLSPRVTCWREIEFEVLNQEQEELTFSQKTRC